MNTKPTKNIKINGQRYSKPEVLFVDAYLKFGETGVTEAAIQAGYTEKGQNGYKLLKNKRIKALIAYKKAKAYKGLNINNYYIFSQFKYLYEKHKDSNPKQAIEALKNLLDYRPDEMKENESSNESNTQIHIHVSNPNEDQFKDIMKKRYE